MKIKFIVLGLLFITFFSCCEDFKKDLETTKENLKHCTEELEKLRTQKHVLSIEVDDLEEPRSPSDADGYEGICSDKSVDETKSTYHISSKKTTLFMPVPHKFSKPYLIKSSSTSLTFQTDGVELVEKYKTHKVKVKNTAFNTENLEVILIINYEIDKTGCIKPMPHRNKTSVIAGTDPIDPNKEK